MIKHSIIGAASFLAVWLSAVTVNARDQAPVATSTPPNHSGEAKLEDYSACGVNALYIILKMRGADVSYENVYRDVKPDGKGFCSMADLARVTRSAGLVPVALKLPAEAWPLLDSPAVARVADALPSQKEGEESGAHFLVFAGDRADDQGDEWIYLINPPHSPLRTRKADFVKTATGQFLAVCRDEAEAKQLLERVKGHATGSAKIYALFSAAALALVATTFWWPVMRLRRPAVNTSKSA